MTYSVLLLALAAFLICLRATRLVERVSAVISGTRHALSVIQNNKITEDQKETILQSAATRTFALFLGILVRTALATGVAILLVYIAIRINLISIPAVEAIATDWVFILVAIGFTALFWRVIK